MAIELADIHPEIIRAHQMVIRAESIHGDEYAYGNAVNQARVTKANRFLAKKIKKHFPNQATKERIELLTFLCQNVHWNEEEAA
jgi:hypothetical protein